MVSTRDARSREKREEDRKFRQIEKLPKPEALHDFQYPYEKTVLSDHMFQAPVFENELDTPHLFHSVPPPDFFLYWNHSQFNRTNYPQVPAVDHRVLRPDDSSEAWVAHRGVCAKYIQKHELTPFFPHVAHSANLSVVFTATFDPRLRRDADDPTLALPPPPPPTELNARNFWSTAHSGNYIELFEVQDAPSVFFHVPTGSNDGDLYTLVMASPDFPYRTAPDIANRGFFLNYVVANLTATTDGTLGKGKGDVVVSYVPPLPTEDAGTTRHMCMLYKQSKRVDCIRLLSPQEEMSALPHTSRSNYRMHQYSSSAELSAQVPDFFRLPAVEAALEGPHPSALTFFQTKWDIHVQEYYDRIQMPEPRYQMGEEIEAILDFNARSSESLRVQSRHLPDGSTNEGLDPQFWTQSERARMTDGTMRGLWSRRTTLGVNKKVVVTPYTS